MKYWLRSLIKQAKHESSTTHVLVPKGPLHKSIIDLAKTIPDDDLYNDEEGDKGRETEPHVTVRYGITDTTPDKIVHAVSHTGPIRIKLGPISKFDTNPAYDVLKLDIDSPHLHRLNSLVDSNAPFKSEFRDYHPHITLAYVRKGKASHLVGMHPFKGMGFTASSLQFRNPLGESTDIPTLDPSKMRQYLKDELLELRKELQNGVRLPQR